MKHFPIRELGYAIGFIVLLAAIYVGAYYAMVDRVNGDWHPHPLRPIAYSAFYGVNDSWAQSLFGPAHQLDRLYVRPDYWAD